jgi:hypothetical protein
MWWMDLINLGVVCWIIRLQFMIQVFIFQLITILWHYHIVKLPRFVLCFSWYGINYKPYLLTPPPNYYVPPIFYSFAHWVLGLGGDIVVGNQHVHATLMLHPPHTIIDLVGLVNRVVVGKNWNYNKAHDS